MKPFWVKSELRSTDEISVGIPKILPTSKYEYLTAILWKVALIEVLMHSSLSKYGSLTNILILISMTVRTYVLTRSDTAFLSYFGNKVTRNGVVNLGALPPPPPPPQKKKKKNCQAFEIKAPKALKWQILWEIHENLILNRAYLYIFPPISINQNYKFILVCRFSIAKMYLQWYRHQLYSTPSAIRFVRQMQIERGNHLLTVALPANVRQTVGRLYQSPNPQKMVTSEREIITRCFNEKIIGRRENQVKHRPNVTRLAKFKPLRPTVFLGNANVILWRLKIHARWANPFFLMCYGLWNPPRREACCRRVSGTDRLIWILDKINLCNILNHLCICIF